MLDPTPCEGYGYIPQSNFQYTFRSAALSDSVVDLIAKKYIQRRDVRAIQRHDGSWAPDTFDSTRDGERIPWNRAALEQHVAGNQTFGHYLLDKEDKCKLFSFDVDLNKSGKLPLCLVDPAASEQEIEACYSGVDGYDQLAEIPDLRSEWLNRSSNARQYMKIEFREIGHFLARGIYENLGLPCAVAYTGAKGIHVYAFTGTISASDAREGAMIVLEALGDFNATRGTNFFEHPKWSNLSIELFPKQDSLDGKDLGNLMSLPLGRNQKSADPKFFIDLRAPMADFVPVDPIFALTAGNPWSDK